MCRSLSKETRKARKPHVCTWCGQRIEAGTSYVHERVAMDDGLSTNDLHHECDDALSEEARLEGGCFEFCPGEGERPVVRPTVPTEPQRVKP